MHTFLSSNLRRQFTNSWHLLTVFVGFVLIGWLMNGFEASIMVWMVTLAVSCYLTWVGSGGVALASIWVVGLMSMAAIHQLWFHNMPRPEFRYIPMTLLANWLLVLAIVWRLGKLSDNLRKTTLPRMLVFFGLISVVVTSLIFGWQSYAETLLLFPSF